MKFVTYRTRDEPGGDLRLGLLDDGGILALDGSLGEELRRGDILAGLKERAVSRASVVDDRMPLGDVELQAPLPRPNSMRDFMLVEEHVRGSLGSVPPEWYQIPVYWKGNCDTVFAPGAIIPWPYYTDKLDFELEFAAIIGSQVSRVSVADAPMHIAGFTIFNDWSARDIQFREMTVGLGVGLSKDFATSMGPYFVTADEFDAGSATTRVRVNGEVWSEGHLGAMQFSFAEVISHLSQEQVLMPGDVLGSGTVANGCGLELDRWIETGDLVELEITGLGVLRNIVGQKNPPPAPGQGIASILIPAAVQEQTEPRTTQHEGARR